MPVAKKEKKSRAIRVISLISIVFVCAGCGGNEPAPEPGPPPPPPKVTPKEPVAKAADASVEKKVPERLGPLPVPAVRFSDIRGERIDGPVEVAPVEKGPVLLIVIDAMNASHLGPYGYARPTSPNIDGIAKRGIVFSNHIANSSWTRPTFATIVTGQPKNVHGMEVDCPPIPEELETLAERFGAEGYATGGFVGNPLVQSRWGFAQGFDTYVDAAEMNYFRFADDAVVRKEAKRWIKAHRDEPFFATVFFTAPHSTYDPPRGYREFFRGLPEGDIVAQPLREYPRGMDEGDLAWTVAAYDGEVAYMDAQVGKLLAGLKKMGIRDKTTIVVTADHGEAFGDHNCFKHAYHQWQSVLNVPMIIDSPAIVAAGAYEDRPTTHVDIAATLLDLVGASARARGLPGISVADFLADPSANRERIVSSLHNAHGVQRQSVYKGRYKLVHHHQVDPAILSEINKLHSRQAPAPDPANLPTLSFDGERYELFDLARDPGENENLFEERKDEPETIELLAALKEIMEPDDDVTIRFDGDLRDVLRELGYLEDEEKRVEGKAGE